MTLGAAAIIIGGGDCDWWGRRSRDRLFGESGESRWQHHQMGPISRFGLAAAANKMAATRVQCQCPTQSSQLNRQCRSMSRSQTTWSCPLIMTQGQISPNPRPHNAVNDFIQLFMLINLFVYNYLFIEFSVGCRCAFYR